MRVNRSLLILQIDEAMTEITTALSQATFDMFDDTLFREWIEDTQHQLRKLPTILNVTLPRGSGEDFEDVSDHFHSKLAEHLPHAAIPYDPR